MNIFCCIILKVGSFRTIAVIVFVSFSSGNLNSVVLLGCE